MDIIRSFIFNILFFSFTGVFLSFWWPLVYLGPITCVRTVSAFYTKGVLFLLKWCVGITHRVEQLSILETQMKKGPCIIASQHQSFWETLIFFIYAHSITLVVKKELFFLPVFGTYLRKARSIRLDRKKGIQSLRFLIEKGQALIQDHISIVIFPEGTRRSPGDPVEIKKGFLTLYHELNVPIIPVCLNSGLFLKRRSFLKKKGVIILKFCEPILPGLSKKDVMKQLTLEFETSVKHTLT